MLRLSLQQTLSVNDSKSKFIPSLKALEWHQRQRKNPTEFVAFIKGVWKEEFSCRCGSSSTFSKEGKDDGCLVKLIKSEMKRLSDVLAENKVDGEECLVYSLQHGRLRLQFSRHDDNDDDDASLHPELKVSLKGDASLDIQVVVEDPIVSWSVAAADCPHHPFLSYLNKDPENFVGYRHHFSSLRDTISDYFYCYHHPDDDDTSSKTLINPTHSLLVSGPAGLGKRSLIVATAKSLNLPLFYFHIGLELQFKSASASTNSTASSSNSPLDNLIQDNLMGSSPCILLLDGLELVTKYLNGRDAACWNDFEDSLLQSIYTKLSIFIQANALVFITATCTDYTKLDSTLFKQGHYNDSSAKRPLLESLIEIEMPGLEQRRDFIALQLEKMNVAIEAPEYLARASNGLTFRKIANLILQAKLQQSDDEDYKFVEKARLLFHESITKMAKLAQPNQFLPTRPNFTWSDIYGYSALKNRLEKLVIWPLEKANVYKRLGVKAPRGILIYGPVGVGKTRIVHGLASIVSANFISVRINQIYGKYLGDSELAIRNIFKAARKASPCILFIDSIDVIGTRREWSDADGTGGVSERVLSTLLNEMDGIAGLDGVLVMACTNQVHLLDDALTRPGRFDAVIEVHLPTLQDRIDILKGICAKAGALSIGQEDDEEISRIMGLLRPESTGADIEYYVREAGLLAFREHLQLNLRSGVQLQNDEIIKITLAHLEKVIRLAFEG